MIIDLLDEAGGAPGSIALVGPERSWTYAELELAVSARADELRSEGVAPGRILPLALDASAGAVIHLLALWRLGVTPAPLNTKLTRAEQDAATGVLSREEAGPQAVLWTSGTAGRPRGVAISYRNLAASALAARERLGLGPDDVWLASLSPAHIGGLALITRALLLGSRLVAVGPFSAERTLRLIDEGPVPEQRRHDDERAPVSHASVVPTQLLRLLDLRGERPPPETFRCALVGGARAPTDLVRRALALGWPLALTYGMTEATSQVATASPPLTADKPGTVGKPLDAVEVRLAEDGEILVRGATVVSGYVGVEDRTVAGPDGWLHTGDLGRLDEDGDLWITGRRVDRIVTGGVTVDAVEVEEAIRAYEGVRDVCVVGLPDAEWGERVAASVVPAGDSVDLDALSGFLRATLSGPKLPRIFHVCPELPRNPNGKVDRRAVRGALEGASAS
jgi:O-succinylbenzoic acid--CoA ligase